MTRATVACGNNTPRKANEQQQRARMLRADADGNLVRLTEEHQNCIMAPAFGHNDCSTCALRNANIGFAGGQHLCQRWYPGRLAICSQTSLNAMGNIEGMGSRTPSRNPPQRSNMDGPDLEAPTQQSPALSPPRTREPQSVANWLRSTLGPATYHATFGHGPARRRVGQIAP